MIVVPCVEQKGRMGGALVVWNTCSCIHYVHLEMFLERLNEAVSCTIGGGGSGGSYQLWYDGAQWR